MSFHCVLPMPAGLEPAPRVQHLDSVIHVCVLLEPERPMAKTQWRSPNRSCRSTTFCTKYSVGTSAGGKRVESLSRATWRTTSSKS